VACSVANPADVEIAPPQVLTHSGFRVSDLNQQRRKREKEVECNPRPAKKSNDTNAQIARGDIVVYRPVQKEIDYDASQGYFLPLSFGRVSRVGMNKLSADTQPICVHWFKSSANSIANVEKICFEPWMETKAKGKEKPRCDELFVSQLECVESGKIAKVEMICEGGKSLLTPESVSTVNEILSMVNRRETQK
jgi:hypothetical protein